MTLNKSLCDSDHFGIQYWQMPSLPDRIFFAFYAVKSNSSPGVEKHEQKMTYAG
jgi:hypothetical protein